MSSNLRLRVCTWNVGNAHPPCDITQWLLGYNTTEEYDVIAIGVQEARVPTKENNHNYHHQSSTTSTSNNNNNNHTNHNNHTLTSTNTPTEHSYRYRSFSPPRSPPCSDLASSPYFYDNHHTSATYSVTNVANPYLANATTSASASASASARHPSSLSSFRRFSRVFRSVRRHCSRADDVYSSSVPVSPPPSPLPSDLVDVSSPLTPACPQSFGPNSPLGSMSPRHSISVPTSPLPPLPRHNHSTRSSSSYARQCDGDDEPDGADADDRNLHSNSDSIPSVNHISIAKPKPSQSDARHALTAAAIKNTSTANYPSPSPSSTLTTTPVSSARQFDSANFSVSVQLRSRAATEPSTATRPPPQSECRHMEGPSAAHQRLPSRGSKPSAPAPHLGVSTPSHHRQARTSSHHEPYFPRYSLPSSPNPPPSASVDFPSARRGMSESVRLNSQYTTTAPRSHRRSSTASENPRGRRRQTRFRILPVGGGNSETRSERNDYARTADAMRSYPSGNGVDPDITSTCYSAPAYNVGPCEEEDEAKPERTTERKFSRVVEKCMPSCYQLVAKHHMLEMKIIVYVHERVTKRVTKAEVVAEATGIGGILGNKGAVAVKLTLDDTAFCFVSSHLAAHEGAKFLKHRIDDVYEIMRNIERERVLGMPMIHSFDHVFWMGDLNFRLDLKEMIPAAINWPHAKKWAHVMEMIEHKRYGDLAALDELRREMLASKVFCGFVEGGLDFAPTFKVCRGMRTAKYQRTRVPSYCDRILWHSLPMHRKHVTQLSYGSVESIDTSDHKPVYAEFTILIPKQTKFFPIPAPLLSLKCTLDFLHIEVHGLYLKKYDVEGTVDDSRYEITEDGALNLIDYGIRSDTSGSGGGGSTDSSCWGTGAIESGAGDSGDGVTNPLGFDYTQQNYSTNAIVGSEDTNLSTPRRRTTLGLSPGLGRSGSGQERSCEGGGESSTQYSIKTNTTGSSGARNTRRGVSAYFIGGGTFVRGRPIRTDIPLRDGRRLCVYKELPCIPLRPIISASDLMYKYIRIVFSRLGSKQGSSCVLPLAAMVRLPGKQRVSMTLPLTKYGTSVAHVDIEVELVMSMDTWLDSRDHIVRTKC